MLRTLILWVIVFVLIGILFFLLYMLYLEENYDMNNSPRRRKIRKANMDNLVQTYIEDGWFQMPCKVDLWKKFGVRSEKELKQIVYKRVEIMNMSNEKHDELEND